MTIISGNDRGGDDGMHVHVRDTFLGYYGGGRGVAARQEEKHITESKHDEANGNSGAEMVIRENDDHVG